MSTFYSASSDQRDATTNLCSRDPEHASYDSIPSNMMYLNYSSSAPYSEALTGNSQCQRSCIDLPVTTTILPQDDPRMSLRTQFGILNGQNLTSHQPNISAMQNQGLSLSLGTQIPIPSFQFRPTNSDISFIIPQQSASGNGGSFREETFQNKSTHGNISHYGLTNLSSSIPDSKYLKAAQDLLDEVVNVRTALKQKTDKSQSLPASVGANTGKDTSGGSKSESIPSNPQDSTANSSDDLSPSERLDLQNKVTKLLAMLDEVDRRYKQYYHQMQIVVSSFDAIAGIGAAKPYTALALQTISGHYRCLKDAISDQIRATRKLLGEQDNPSSKGGLSRLRYIDQQLRQQRAMQQFGMMPQHAWRPQRGLPESSVSILRAWLFEHFLHPYPKDSEKLMLARQTGLTRSQVSNWFINARVRLWKPMIEDMYKEEVGDVEMDSNSSSENPPSGKDGRSSKEREDLQSPAAERCQTNQFSESSRTNMASTMEMTEPASGYQNEGTPDTYMNFKLIDQRSIGADSTFLEEAITNTDGGGRFMAYQMAGLGRYGGNNGVSLTLGLQHCNGGLPVPDNSPNFLGARGNDIYTAAAPVGADAADYDYTSMGDQRHRFSSHLLHDFVA